ncbi:MAG TPA: four helix bundle protein [Fimbriimonadaceae bacterium]|nr:four helix bundle protein [Fimbriimonadaceae bacterium]
MRIDSYEDLEIWQLGMELLVEVYAVVEALPQHERFNLINQMSRAAVSIPSNIAEGWGRGRSASQAHFIRVSRGSLYELATQLEAARRIGYISDSQAEPLRLRTIHLGKKINAYLSWLEGSFVREEKSLYGDVQDEHAP